MNDVEQLKEALQEMGATAIHFDDDFPYHFQFQFRGKRFSLRLDGLPEFNISVEEVNL